MTKIIRKRNKLGQFTKMHPWDNIEFKRKATSVLLMTLLLVGLLGTKETKSYYNDTENSENNSFIAGLIDFSLGVSDWQPINTAVSMTPGDTTKKTVEVDPKDSNPFQYYTESTNETGDSDFCNGLIVTAKLDGVEVYNGPIVDLLTTPTETLDSWEFIYTSNNDFQNKVCDFDIDYNGWQTRHNLPTYENGGYSDTEKVSNHLASWGFRINKVYYDVKSPERGAEGTNEWVEIYNQTNTPLDISGWQICDNISCNILPTTPLIPALKYAIIVADTTTVSSLLPAYWYLPSEVTLINIGSEIGNGLANNADMLTLKRPDGVIVDQMNWGTPDTNWTNYNENIWNPGAVDVAEGNVLARIPSGYDTDQASDWKELEPPSVDLLYPDEGGSYTWYWGNSYTITWIATNNNGADSDLDMSIFYIKDVNHDNIISVGDTTFMIAGTTTNDGSFKWTVPFGFTGYIWIYLVATGPENPMLNSGTVSGKIYDPIPIFIGPENVMVPELPTEEDVVEPSSSDVSQGGPVEEGTTNPIVEEEETVVLPAETESEETIEGQEEIMTEEVVEIPPVIETEEVIIEESEVVEETEIDVAEPVIKEEEPVIETIVEEEPIINSPEEIVVPEESSLSVSLPEEIPPAPVEVTSNEEVSE